MDKVAIVTGSSRGIGKGIAKELLLAGSKVILNGRNEDRLKATQLELLKISKDVHYLCCDVTNTSIVHPAVMKDFELWTQEHKDEPYSLKEAALLFESDSYKNLHKVIVINSPIETRIERVVKRDHVKREDVLKRIENQSTDRERMEKADWIIYNDGINSLIEQAMKIHNQILEIREQGTIPFKV